MQRYEKIWVCYEADKITCIARIDLLSCINHKHPLILVNVWLRNIRLSNLRINGFINTNYKYVR